MTSLVCGPGVVLRERDSLLGSIRNRPVEWDGLVIYFDHGPQQLALGRPLVQLFRDMNDQESFITLPFLCFDQRCFAMQRFSRFSHQAVVDALPENDVTHVVIHFARGGSRIKAILSFTSFRSVVRHSGKD